MDEAAVDLDGVDRQFLQIGQGGIAGAEVINRNLDAHVGQFAQFADGAIDVAHQCAFGNLDLDAMSVRYMLAQTVHELFDELRVFDLARGEIDRHRDLRQHVAAPELGLAAGFVHDPFADRRDEAAFFGDGNEIGR